MPGREEVRIGDEAGSLTETADKRHRMTVDDDGKRGRRVRAYSRSNRWDGCHAFSKDYLALRPKMQHELPVAELGDELGKAAGGPTHCLRIRKTSGHGQYRLRLGDRCGLWLHCLLIGEIRGRSWLLRRKKNLSDFFRNHSAPRVWNLRGNSEVHQALGKHAVLFNLLAYAIANYVLSCLADARGEENRCEIGQAQTFGGLGD
ncbi:hypothetical protein HPB50_010310 [Hyalomma asiaticum]|uniref:Uncharacterized protein n=1 Tax=Hyalomma asiaticum TaxID=266040 RepID=A0ACB7SPI0_HYAAI|nr:hypothetical protein HPB50_010310 [Hyalomma asiaticum]